MRVTIFRSELVADRIRDVDKIVSNSRLISTFLNALYRFAFCHVLGRVWEAKLRSCLYV